MEIEGKISLALEPQSGVSQRTGNSWKSQDFVMDYFWFPNQQNPSKLTFRVFGEDRLKQFNLQQGDEVKVRLSIEANEYNGRWFNEVRAHAVTFVGASASKNPQPAADPSTGSGTAGDKPAEANPSTGSGTANVGTAGDKPADPSTGSGTDEDDLPF